MKLKILFCMLVACLLMACASEEPMDVDKIKYVDHFVRTYINPTEAVMHSSNDVVENRGFITFQGSCLNEADFNQMVAKTGDDHFHAPSYMTVAALGRGINKIKVTTISDFDEQHPAESDVSDLMSIQWISYANYIANNYVASLGDHGDKSNYQVWTASLLRQGAKLDSCDLVDFKSGALDLISPRMLLKFKQAPARKGRYTFNVGIETEGKLIYTSFIRSF